MAQSKLAAQLHEATQAARDLNSEAVKFGQLKANYASDMAPGGGANGGGGTVLVTPSGQPISPVGGGGASNISEFLARLAGRNNSEGGTRSSSDGQGGGLGEGGGRTISLNPANESEKSIMKSLGESLEYVRKLIAAAKWAKIPEWTVLRAPKGERDALIAAYEAHKQESASSSGGGGSSGGGSGVSRTTAYQEQNGTAFTSVATNNQPNASTASAKATVAALGSVVNELKTLNKAVARKDSGMPFRTGEI